MTILKSTLAALLFAASIHPACHAADAVGKPSRVDKAFLAAEHIPIAGKLVRADRIDDAEGQHVLVLSRKEGPSQDEPTPGRMERVDLTVGFYTRVRQGTWMQEWTIRDNSDCPELDVSGEFSAANVSFSDVNKDGRVEVAVPYRLFCGGGMDSHTLKLILREGATKLAIRGEELYPDTWKHDKLLQSPAYAAYKKQMDAVWKRVVAEPHPSKGSSFAD